MGSLKISTRLLRALNFRGSPAEISVESLREPRSIFFDFGDFEYRVSPLMISPGVATPNEMQSLRSAVTCTISRDYVPSCRCIYGIIDSVMENLSNVRESELRLRVSMSRAIVNFST